MIIIIGTAARWLDLHAEGNKYWLSLCNHEMKKPKFPLLFHLQVQKMPYHLVTWEAQQMLFFYNYNMWANNFRFCCSFSV